jgi:hypothetical protein
MKFYSTNTLSLQQAALRIAGKGKAVFPCGPDKAPHTPRGFKDATTDPRRVTAFWNRHPDARIGVPTGSRSSVFVVDVDRLEALGELERELPETLTIRTPSGGLHFYFNYLPGLTNSPGNLPAGIDIRGEGGYVIVPPSPGYSVERHGPIADAPEWLLEKLRDKLCVTGARGCSSGATGRERLDVPHDGPIGAGRRNQTLASIGGRCRAEGKSREEIEAELLAINAERCTPALPLKEVVSIAASVSRYPAGNLKPAPDRETLAIIDAIDRRAWSKAWPGMGGKSERDVMLSLIDLARMYGQRVEDGIEVSVGVRTLALRAALSKQSCLKALKRLYEQGEVRKGTAGSGTKAGTIVLLGRANLDHSTTEVSYTPPIMASGQPLRAPRLRWSSPQVKPKRGFVRDTRKVREAPKPEAKDRLNRLGKTAGAVVDALDRFGPTLSLAEIAEILGVTRPRDLRRRVIARLEAAGVVTVAGNLISLTSDWLGALNRERELSGEIAQHKRQMQDNNLEQRKWRNRHKLPKADPVPEPPDSRTKPEEETSTSSSLAIAIRDYLARNPYDACQPPGWIGVTLWAYSLHPSKPSAAEVKSAIGELGGESYRRECLARARREAA